jgi:hypothetical protein
MKEFPRFNDSQMQCTFTANQMKLLLTLVRDSLDKLDQGISKEDIAHFVQLGNKINSTYTFTHYQAMPEKLFSDIDALYESLLDPFIKKKLEYVELFREDLNRHFEENYDREVFYLEDGQTLKIADSGTVYG